MPSRNIVELMRVPPPEHDIKWLIDALGNAVQLELATLPPYLCAYWSIKKDSSNATSSFFNSIFMQEMLHMGLAANMLVGIGGIPEIDTAIPKYPGHLPGGVSPDLIVYLEGLTPAFVHDVCMQIEMPELPLARATLDEFPTIGAFYDEISKTFKALEDTLQFSDKYQQESWIGLTKIARVQDAQDAIELIKVQGEGTSLEPFEGGNDLAHYYKFGSIYHGHELSKKDDQWVWEGKVVPWPEEVWPVAKVPEGGWVGQATTPEAVKTLLLDFNSTFKTLLQQLQGAWTGDGSVDDTYSTMRRLTSKAGDIVQLPIGDGTNGNYGPDFVVS